MNKENINEVYKAYPILEYINQKNKGILSDQFRVKRIEAGEYLKGEECPGFIFIIKGQLKIEKIDLEGRQTYLYVIGRGEICHESLSCHLNCETLEIVGCALEPTQIGILPREVVRRYLLEDLDFMHYLYKNLYHKFKTIIEHKESIIHDSVEERLWEYIKRRDTGVIYATHQEIAIELGTSREVISRKLKSLEKEGKVEIRRGKIRVVKH